MSARPLRIGYVNQDFPPEVGAGPARVLELATHWQQAGAEVTVITGMPNRRMAGLADGAIHPDYRGRFAMEQDWDGVRVLRTWLYASPRRGFAHTLLNNASFALTSTLYALRRAPRFDVLIASSPPFLAHLTGEALRRRQRVPLVLEIRDLWPDYMVELGVLRSRLAQRALFGLERALLRRAAHAVVVTESFRRRAAEKGVAADRIDVVPNGVDLERYRRIAEPVLPAGMIPRDASFVVGYLGNFGAGQELRTVIDAAKRLERELPGVRFVLVGDGKEKPRVERHVAEVGAHNVAIHPPIEKDLTPAFYNACDVCLVPLAPVPIFAETVPSKLFEVMACERPLVAGVAGEAARVVEESGGGMVTPPGDAAALARAIVRLYGADPAVRAMLGRHGREYVAAHYSRAALADRYLALLHRIAGRAAPGHASPALSGTAGCRGG